MKPYFETDLGKLYHGDCLEIMPELEPVDLILTDPPSTIETEIPALTARSLLVSEVVHRSESSPG